MSSETPASLTTWAVLRSLGFTPDGNVFSDPPGGLSYDFGNLKLSASHQINRWFQPIVMLGGVLSTARTVAMIECEMPQLLESWVQGAAWVAWCLDKAASTPFEPAIASPWLTEGRRHRHLLPWERDQAAYDARPHCAVERDWTKIAFRKLTPLLAEAVEDDALQLSFDGEVLKLRLGRELIAVPAHGAPWPSAFVIPASGMRTLPRRLTTSRVEFGVWDGRLTVGNYRYSGVAPVAPQSAEEPPRTARPGTETEH